MSWKHWIDELREAPHQAVADLLRGAADVSPFERVSPHEFLLAVLPRTSRSVSGKLLGQPLVEINESAISDLPTYVDEGLSAWLMNQRQAQLPPAKKLGAYAAQVCEALQWPLFFSLPQTRSMLLSSRAQWLKWLGTLSLSAYRDPEYDYWQMLASQQTDDQFQFVWQSFIVEAGRTRSLRYLNLGLLALARLPLSEDDSLRNLRLQVQALISRYQLRKVLGTVALEELVQNLRSVMVRNPSLNATHYQAFLTSLFSPLGDDKTASLLSLLGLSTNRATQGPVTSSPSIYRLEPPGKTAETDQTVWAVNNSSSLAQAWQSVRPLLAAHEEFLHKSGDAYYFIRNLDRCVRALCKKYSIRDPEIRSRLFEWIHLALLIDAEDEGQWMLWQLLLRQVGELQRGTWVLWEMTRRFPAHIPCRVELARLLAESDIPDDQAQAHRLLQQVLQLDQSHLHAHSTLAQLAIHRKDWSNALAHAQQGLKIEPTNEPCAVLLASAYVRRNNPDDLQTAITHLQRFVSRNPGQVNAEQYLSKLLRRQISAAPIPDAPLKGRVAVSTVSPLAESDPAWRAFGESINLWLAASSNEIFPHPETEITFSADRVLPFPQALSLAMEKGQLDVDVLTRYDSATEQEFPLETRLYRYLLILKSASTTIERRRAEHPLQSWLETERHVAAQNDSPWVAYLNRRMTSLDAPVDVALVAGANWLRELLDRYRPLPAPLFG